jgi:WD40 repeat protein
MKRMKSLGSLLLLTVVLTACVHEGISGLSSNNQAALITDGRLIAWDLTTGAYEQIQSDSLLWGFGASVNQSGDVLYARLSGSTIQICIFRASAHTSTCPISLGQGNVSSGGLLSYLPTDLPNGDLVVVYDGRMRVYTDLGTELALDIDAGLFVTAPHLYKIKRGTGGSEWYMKPYSKSGCAQEQKLYWVVIQDSNWVYRYSVGASLEGATRVHQITADIRAVLDNRAEGTVGIRAVALSPDGTKLVIQTASGELLSPGPWNLYVLDLLTDSGGLDHLVTDADFRIQYAFSPCGDQLAYESNADGGSVWILDFASGLRAKLADGASMPQWYPE